MTLKIRYRIYNSKQNDARWLNPDINSYWVIFMLLLSSADFLEINFLKKNLSGALFECKMVRIRIWTHVLSILICIQTVFKGYQQMIKVAASKARVEWSHCARESSTLCLLLSSADNLCKQLGTKSGKTKHQIWSHHLDPNCLTLWWYQGSNRQDCAKFKNF